MSQIIKVKGHGVSVPGNDIDTDRIVPARFLKEITFDRMGEYLFYDVRFDANGNKLPHPLNNAKYDQASVMLVGKNFGCGSSREHAPQAILRYGIKAIIGESFAEIFSGNCKALGILAVTASEDTLLTLSEMIEKDPKTMIAIDISDKQVSAGETSFKINLPHYNRQAFLNGQWNVNALLLENKSQIIETAKKLPYLQY